VWFLQVTAALWNGVGIGSATPETLKHAGSQLRSTLRCLRDLSVNPNRFSKLARLILADVKLLGQISYADGWGVSLRQDPIGSLNQMLADLLWMCFKILCESCVVLKYVLIVNPY
jgi:hypothetical protein